MDFMNDGGPVSADRALELWAEYQGTGDEAVRDRIVLAFVPMVKYVVSAAAPGGDADIARLVATGLEALVRGVDGYEPQSGLTLQQSCWQQVRTAVVGATAPAPAAAAAAAAPAEATPAAPARQPAATLSWAA